MEITKNGSRTVNQGPPEYFTGSVHVEPLAAPHEPARVLVSNVTFEPGARSAWHTHPLGQTLIVTEGCGFVQCWGEPVRIIRPGDVIWTPPSIKHWHGAIPTSRMTHITVLEHLNGKNADWMEQVTDEEYRTCCSCIEAPQSFNTVAPALDKYEQNVVSKQWGQPDLSARDRSIVTLSALIAKNQTVEMSQHVAMALDNGVESREISEIITHLAFYSGWSNALSAAQITSTVFARRKIGADALPLASPKLLPIDEATESVRAANVASQFDSVAPEVVKNTTDVLFRDLWLRPDLRARDRSLVTVSALIASAQVAQIPFHLNRAMDNGLTKEQAAAVLSHLAFYVGWPNVMSAMPVAKEVFEKRAK